LVLDIDWRESGHSDLKSDFDFPVKDAPAVPHYQQHISETILTRQFLPNKHS